MLSIFPLDQEIYSPSLERKQKPCEMLQKTVRKWPLSINSTDAKDMRKSSHSVIMGLTL